MCVCVYVCVCGGGGGGGGEVYEVIGDVRISFFPQLIYFALHTHTFAHRTHCILQLHILSTFYISMLYITEFYS